MSGSRNLQDACLRLQHFWMNEGCLMLPAHDEPLVAGILHPNALLSLFSRTPRSLSYLQPVRRPLDGRHGGQSYRLARHLQHVVLLRPAPEDLAQRFLASLRSLSIALENHDVRFTEGRWSLPGADSWGVGWNVRIDGVGVARVTFIQRLAGQQPQPVAAEIAYGVERLLTSAVGTASAYDIAWSDAGPDLGALWRIQEENLARYAFEVAEPDHLRARLAANAAEAAACIEAGLASAACSAAVRDLYLLDLLAARRELTRSERNRVESRVASILQAAAAQVMKAEAAATQKTDPKPDPDAGGGASPEASPETAKEPPKPQRRASRRRKPRPKKRDGTSRDGENRGGSES